MTRLSQAMGPLSLSLALGVFVASSLAYFDPGGNHQSPANWHSPRTYTECERPSTYPRQCGKDYDYTAFPQNQSYRADAVVEMFRFAWDGYYKYAYPHDDLLPKSNNFSDSRNGWGLLMVDSLDTAIIMEQQDIVDIITEFIPTVDFTKNNSPKYVQLNVQMSASQASDQLQSGIDEPVRKQHSLSWRPPFIVRPSQRPILPPRQQHQQCRRPPFSSQDPGRHSEILLQHHYRHPRQLRLHRQPNIYIRPALLRRPCRTWNPRPRMATSLRSLRRPIIRRTCSKSRVILVQRSRSLARSHRRHLQR